MYNTPDFHESLEGFTPLTRIEQTKIDYLKKSQQLLNRAKKEMDIPLDEELDVRQFVVWLVELKPTISRNTWRFYKSSVVYYLENYEDAQAAIEAMEYIKEVTSSGALTTTERTSSLKLKKITFEDWLKLDTYLKAHNQKWHGALRAWLRSSVITGLRPIEWKNSLFFSHEGQPALKILNAKATNGRGNGESRTLLLKDVSDDDLKIIKEHLNNVRKFVGMDEYEYFYRGCAISLYKACRRCWPKRKRHITLYSTRHQFTANAKSSGFSRLAIAAMMGHAVDITASIHYGKKVAGNESISISPLSQEVATVRNVENGYPQYKSNITTSEGSSGSSSSSGTSRSGGAKGKGTSKFK
jgi:hypothetical protein